LWATARFATTTRANIIPSFTFFLYFYVSSIFLSKQKFSLPHRAGRLLPLRSVTVEARLWQFFSQPNQCELAATLFLPET
jgi:hypothetical protein